ncbi:phage antirepressor [Yersinia aldovae]|uniref:phage antirepressor N-terminal domain-containing protein n=1 Tax=Yersinia aldovae TaxID=29483 RepID=UPI0005DD811E|nr:phage antirepressor N-terminal domain-containing protein [Yersinia aldovae]CNJ18847.1 phage antirepressor [Yersinia aldovae]
MTSIAIIEAVNTTAVQFHGQPIVTAMVAGVAYVAMRPIVENIGIDWSGQMAKLKNQRDKFGCRDISTPSKGGVQKMLCIPLRKLNGWLFSINPEKVRADIRDKLIQYQEECFAVLHEYWTKGLVVNPRKATKKALPGKITLEQQEAVKQLVMNRGKALPKENQAKAIITMWSALKTHFGCSYKEINEDQFTDALSLAARVPIEGEFLGKQEALPEPAATNRRYLVCVRIKDEITGGKVELNISAETFASMVTGISTSLGYEPIGFNKVPAAKHLIKQIH